MEIFAKTDITVPYLVMFRLRFASLFEGTPDVGPQEIEQGVTSDPPSEAVMHLMVRLVSLALNRKRYADLNQHKRAFSEVLQLNWRKHPAKHWVDKESIVHNPFAGDKGFGDVGWEERLVFLRVLVDWSLLNCDALKKVIDLEYSGSRQKGDKKVGISVQPMGLDADRQRYFLVGGQQETTFRFYKETDPFDEIVNFTPVAGDVQELTNFAETLVGDPSRHVKNLHNTVLADLPRLQEIETKRRGREYRAAQKARLAARLPTYEFGTRTRGRRINYENLDETRYDSEDSTSPRNLRRSRIETPPHQTRSLHGRRLRAPRVGLYGEALLTANASSSDESNDRYTSLKRKRSGSGNFEPPNGAFGSSEEDNADAQSESSSDASEITFATDDQPDSLHITLRYPTHRWKDGKVVDSPKPYNYGQVITPCSSLREYLNSPPPPHTPEVETVPPPSTKYQPLPSLRISPHYLGNGLANSNSPEYHRNGPVATNGASSPSRSSAVPLKTMLASPPPANLKGHSA